MQFQMFRILIVFCMTGLSSSLLAAGLDLNKALSARNRHTCMIDANGPHCWGGTSYDDKALNLALRQMKNITQIWAGPVTCAVDYYQDVRCFFFNGREIQVPKFRNLQNIYTAHGAYACGVDDSGVQCFGSGNLQEYGVYQVPRLNRPKMVAPGEFHVCALDIDGVKCWGSNEYGQTNVPRLNRPYSIASGMYTSCALDADGMKCWGRNKFGENTVPSSVHSYRIKDIGIGFMHTCILSDRGIFCWGMNDNDQLSIPPLKNPQKLVSGNQHNCVFDEGRVKCWGQTVALEPYPAPENQDWGTSFLNPDFDLQYLNKYFSILAQSSSPVRAALFRDAEALAIQSLSGGAGSSPYQKTQLTAAKYLLLSFLKPVITSSDSDYSTQKVIPLYQAGMTQVEAELGVSSPAQISDSPLYRQVALKVIQMSLARANDFMTMDDRSQLSKIMVLLGQAMADANRERINELLIEIGRQASILEKLEGSVKTAFVFTTLMTTTEWLKEKLQ